MITWKLVCGNKKCKKETSLVEGMVDHVVEVSLDFNEKTLKFICPHCKNENSISIGVREDKRLPRIGKLNY